MLEIGNKVIYRDCIETIIAIDDDEEDIMQNPFLITITHNLESYDDTDNCFSSRLGAGRFDSDRGREDYMGTFNIISDEFKAGGYYYWANEKEIELADSLMFIKQQLREEINEQKTTV